ncbi:MAG: YciI family protein [Actinomycetota bacterium]|nr:YciI family protein [Actinomycetota bacterium]
MLIYGEEPTSEPSQEQLDAGMAEWWEYDRAIKDSGIHVASDALQPSSAATTVRVKGDERIVTDGPFAETREVLGGFYLIDVPDLDTALDWAVRCPGAKYGSMEVRPVMVFDVGPQ